MLRRYAMFASTACTSRKSSCAAPGTTADCHVAPPSVVRAYVPPLPLAQTIIGLTALTPRNRAVVPLCCGVHCARPAVQRRITHRKREVGGFIASRKFVTRREGALPTSA